MTRYVFFSQSTDGFLRSSSGTYSSARAGTGIVVDNTSSYMYAGQRLATSTYFLYEGFISFDTSTIATTEVIANASILLHLLAVNGSVGAASNPLYARGRAYGTSLDTGDWVPADSLSSSSLFGQTAAALTANSSIHLPLADPGNNSGRISRSTTTQFVIDTQNTEASTTPTGDEYVQINTSEIGTLNDPILLVYTYAPTFASPVAGGTSQLSTGEIVEVQSTGTAGSPTLQLGYYTKFTNTFNVIDSNVNQYLNGTISPPIGMDQVEVVVDSNDQIWVYAPSAVSGNEYINEIAYTRNTPTGYAFTAVLAAPYASPVSSPIASLKAVATTYKDSKGLYVYNNVILVTATAVSSASTVRSRSSILVTGTGGSTSGGSFNLGTGPKPAYTVNAPTVVPAGSFSGSPKLDMVASAEKVLVTASYEAGAGGQVITTIASLTLSAKFTGIAGNTETVTIASQTSPKTLYQTNGYQVMGPESKVRALKTTSNQCTIIYVGEPNTVRAQSVDFSANLVGSASVLTSVIDAGANGVWDTAYDPASNSVWMYYNVPGTPSTIKRVPYRIATALWDTANTYTVTTSAPTTATNTSLWLGRGSSDERMILVFLNNTSGSTRAKTSYIDSFNVAPNAPVFGPIPNFDANVGYTFKWAFSDPNPKDKQAKYEIEIDNNTTLATAIHTGVVTSTATQYTIAASALAQNTTFRIRMRLYDQQNATGTWSNYQTFSTSDVGLATITDPVDDNQTGSADNYLVKWSYTTSGTATQNGFRLKMVRVSDSVTLYDSGAVSSTATSQQVTNIPNGVQVRFDLYLTNTNSQTTQTTSRLFITSYYAPAAITTFAAALNGPQVDLSWTVPGNVGSQNYPQTIAIYRYTQLDPTPVIIGRVDGAVNLFSDLVPAANTAPVYYAVSETDTGSTKSNEAGPGNVAFFGAAINESTSDPANPWYPTLNLFYGGPSSQEGKTLSGTVLQFAGRKRGATAYGTDAQHTVQFKAVIPFIGNPVGSLESSLTSDSTTMLRNFDLMIEDRVVLCFRDGRGRRIFGTVLSYTINDTQMGSELSFTINEADFTEVIS